MEKSHSDDAMMSGLNQLIAPNEIKQEPDIKEEPMTTDGDLVESPAMINDGVGHSSDNLCRNYGGADHVNLPLNEVKVEVKPERAERKKKKKGPKANGRNKGAMDNNRNGQRSLEVDVRTTKKLGIPNAQRNVLKRLQCNQCGYATKYKHHLKVHLLVHSGEKPFPCDHCSKGFTQEKYLNNHMKMHVGEFLFNCATCLKGFNEKDEKFTHEMECRIRRYECHLCKQSFGSMKHNLMSHIHVHSGVKPFECSECLKQFSHRGDFKRHMKTHAGPPSFHCSRCRQGFVYRNEMVAHEQKCNRRLYVCYVCGKLIGLIKGNLDIHMRTHTGDKPFQCTQCPKKCAQKWNLTKHISRIHNKSR